MKRAIVGMALAAAGPALAAEGKWLPSQAGAIGGAMKAAGLAIDPARLGDLSAAPLNAIVSLGGCSASFVSPRGLAVTNHHCVYGSIQYNSRPGQDYLAAGFLAADQAAELPAAPGTRILVIEALDDVTRAMNRGLSAGMDGLARTARIEANRTALIAACERRPGRRCDVRAYYGGARYRLQRQLEIKDVRLVYAPASSIGNFGGEVDNWQWPRHTGDWGFYRAYVGRDGSSATYAKDNVPYQSPAYLRPAGEPLKDGDFVMVAGFPGTTEREATAAEVAFRFDTYQPAMQMFLSDYADAIRAATAGDEAAALRYASIVKGADNYKKNLLGQMAGGEAIGLIPARRAEEQAYRDWAGADPARARYAAAAAALDGVVRQENDRALADLRKAALNRAQLLYAARTAYRWAQERAKPDARRDAGYQDRDRLLVTERLAAIERRYDARVDRALLVQALAEYAKVPAGARDPAFEALVSEIGLDRLYADTTLADTPTRLGWLDRPAADFRASADPFIRLAVAMAPADAAAREAGKAIAGRDQAARSVYMAGYLAYAAAQGRAVPPDANGSLRLTYGNVTGKVRDGMRWTPFTTTAGILEKQTGREPFDAPETLLAAIRAKDWGSAADPALGTVPVDFLSTVDITGGNSGSATLNRKGEFVGLAFDGTLEGVVADWKYDDATNRSIHVDARYMRWVMEKVDHADRLLAEMAGK